MTNLLRVALDTAAADLYVLQSGFVVAFALWRAHFNTAAADPTVF